MLVLNEFQDHDPVFDDRFLEAQTDAGPAHPHDVEQLAGRRGDFAETVAQVRLEDGQPLLVGDVVELAVEPDLLRAAADVLVRNERLAVGLDLAVGDESGGPCLRGKRFLRLAFLRRGGCLLLLAQLGDRLGEDFLVGLESGCPGPASRC